MEILSQCFQETKKMMREQGYETIRNDAFVPSSVRSATRASLESTAEDVEAVRLKLAQLVDDSETLSMTDGSNSEDEEESYTNASPF